MNDEGIMPDNPRIKDYWFRKSIFNQGKVTQQKKMCISKKFVPGILLFAQARNINPRNRNKLKQTTLVRLIIGVIRVMMVFSVLAVVQGRTLRVTGIIAGIIFMVVMGNGSMAKK